MTRLCLVSVKELSWTGKEGEAVTKFKNVFLGENDEVYVAWTNENTLQDRLVESGEYDDARAREYKVSVDEKDGKLVKRVLLT